MSLKTTFFGIKLKQFEPLEMNYWKQTNLNYDEKITALG